MLGKLICPTIDRFHMIIFITGILTDYRRSKNVEKDIKFG